MKEPSLHIELYKPFYGDTSGYTIEVCSSIVYVLSRNCAFGLIKFTPARPLTPEEQSELGEALISLAIIRYGGHKA